MIPLYKRFAGGNNYDFSDKALEEMYKYETFGEGNINNSIFNTINLNGYFIGKKWLNLTVTMWLNDFQKPGWVHFLKDIYSDKSLPRWWLKKIFKNLIREKVNFRKELGLPFINFEEIIGEAI